MLLTQLTVECKFCHKQKEITVPSAGYAAWKEGKMLIQEALPMVRAEEREMLISGICPTCWVQMFGEEDI